MTEEERGPDGNWWIRPEGRMPFVYDPRVHSRLYLRTHLQNLRVSPTEAEAILAEAAELERGALALGYALAEDEHGLDEVTGHHPHRYEEPLEVRPQGVDEPPKGM